MSDAFLMLAQAPAGLSCFFVPRRRDDGTINGIAIQRLKDKLGNRSNASSEIELDAADGWLVGDEGRGVPTIIQMVNHTRLDCVLGASSGMRQAVAQATHHAAHRYAFGRLLIDQPLMRNVLADLRCVESEAATTPHPAAAAYDATIGRTQTRMRWRLPGWPPWASTGCASGTPGSRPRRSNASAATAYVEESIAPAARESPLNGIWEGSGNVICLDVLRDGSGAGLRRHVPRRGPRRPGSRSPLRTRCLRLGAVLSDSDDLETRAASSGVALAPPGGAPDPLRQHRSGRCVLCVTTRSRARSARVRRAPVRVDAEAIVKRAQPVDR
jgi:putative acyl-CoA dehydrogenase